MTIEPRIRITHRDGSQDSYPARVVDIGGGIITYSCVLLADVKSGDYVSVTTSTSEERA